MAENLRFLPYEAVVDASFWHKLCQIKLDVDRLSEAERPLTALALDPAGLIALVDYSSFNECDNSSGKINSSERLRLNHLCRGNNHKIPLSVLSGFLLNFNSLEAFKNVNKNDLLEGYGARISDAIKCGDAIDNPTLLNSFSVITFADLKNYNFVFWFGFPALANYTFPIVRPPVLLKDALSDEQIQSILQSHSNLEWPNTEMFCIVASGSKFDCRPLRYFIDNFEGSEKLYLCMIDGSAEDFLPGWPCRNLLALVAHHRKTDASIEAIILRLGRHFDSSFIIEVKIEGSPDDLKVAGWCRNARGMFGPRSISLRDTIDPLRLAESSVDLNLKLMKWRLAPTLDLETVRSLKVLLIGAGTLGCSVARCLMGWGVRHITFVDSGHVSFSNPVRQSLYGFDDCSGADGPKLKAVAAPAALKAILPTMTSTGVAMTVPMPGHTTEGIKEASELHKLIQDHDAVFLLTDSRESRWLPTVVAASMNKLAITAALGYDTYLVIRHGVRSESSSSKLGCYFCNDVTAPGNSKADRTLDQQCTVTRPGVSNMAGAIAVELLISVLQHPNRGSCNADDETLLGIVPHSVRGFLFQFSHVLPSTPAFNQCIACSPKVIDQYENNREEFLGKVFQSAVYLEELTGLADLHKASEMAEILELSDDESVGEVEM